MINWPNFDTDLLFLINHYRNNYTDWFFWYVSKFWIWIPLWLYIFYKTYLSTFTKNVFFLSLLKIILAIALADFIASGLCKEFFMRFRPSHNPQIKDLLFYCNNYKGGLYGFASSHAANSMAILLGFAFYFKLNKIAFYGLIFYVFSTAYSRVYLGVHYPLDIIGGWAIAFISVAMVSFVSQKIPLLKKHL